jgi:hypothetical protein
VDVGFDGELAHKEKQTATTSETKSQSGQKRFLGFCLSGPC